MSQLEAKGHAAQPDTLEVHADGRVHTHISSFRFYVGIFFTLIAFTLLTVAASDVHLGKLNLVVAVVIASMKASLVVLFFMHLRYDSKFNSMILVLSLLFIGVFFAYTMNDTERRGEIDLEQGVKYLPSTGLAAPGGEPMPAPTASSGTGGPVPASPGVMGGGGAIEHAQKANPAPGAHEPSGQVAAPTGTAAQMVVPAIPSAAAAAASGGSQNPAPAK